MPAKAQMTDNALSMELTCYSHSALRLEAGGKILIDPFPSDNRSWGTGRIGRRAGEDSTQGGGR